VTARGEDHDLKFTIPELAQSRLILDFPAGTSYPQAIAYRGAHRATPLINAIGPAPPAGGRLEVDLGRVNNIHARWREETAPPAPAQVFVREAHLWTTGPDAGTLSAGWQYTVAKGAVTTLAIEPPGEVEVRNAGVDRLPSDGTDEVRPGLHHWSLSGT